MLFVSFRLSIVRAGVSLIVFSALSWYCTSGTTISSYAPQACFWEGRVQTRPSRSRNPEPRACPARYMQGPQQLFCSVAYPKTTSRPLEERQAIDVSTTRVLR